VAAVACGYRDGRGKFVWGVPLTAIEVVVPDRGPRHWHAVLVERLGVAGHAVSVVHHPGADRWPVPMAAALRFERRLFHSMFALEDQKEGMAAFVEKRPPTFRNR